MATIVAVTILLASTLVAMTRGQGTMLTFRINEEEPAGTFVGSVADANLEGTSFRYTIIGTQTDFSLQDQTGNLYTMTKIDRDSKCKDAQSSTNGECVIELLVGAESGTFYATVTVKVVINDVNDNAPLFPSYTHELRIVEGTPRLTEFSIPRAVDTDYGSNGITKYEISPSHPSFGIRATKNLAGKFDVFIVVLDTIDRETEDTYQLEVFAIDGGGRRGGMTVNVIVTDINDNEPVFDRSNYTTTVEEGTARGTVILTIQATDKDIGDNGKVSYKIADGFTLTDFVLNSTSGEIYVDTDDLVYYPGVSYEFVVDAYDHGENFKQKQVYVYINILDTGNNHPQITLNVGNSGFVNISENKGLKQMVAAVTVEDPDTGLNGEVTCSTQESYFSVQKVDNSQFIVVVNSQLNREIIDMHTVNVTCTDNGDPPLSSSKTFLVRVTDENDNMPIFESKSYSAKIDENRQEEQMILKVSATDNDIGDNSKIHYKIVDNDKITVHSVTGVISAKPFFDRESTPVIVFEVLAIDSGAKPLTGTATVTLTIEDVNDNAPKFRQPSYSLEVLENLPSGTYVDQISATDLDIGVNGMFTFSLSSEYLESRLPFIVFENGEIQTNKALDRETRSSYMFDVVVQDQGSPPLDNSVKVTVIVKDVNDNKPNITFPIENNKTVSIYYPNNDLDVVAQVEAYDIDDGENKLLNYNILKGNDLGMFKIDQNTGTISIAKHDIKIDSDMDVTLQVEVNDKGDPVLKSHADLVVSVIYSNATYQDLSGEKDQLVVIVVVVVVVTAVFSAIIIGVIVLLRNWDRKKSLPDSTDKPETTEQGYSSVDKPSLFILNNAGESSTDYPSPYAEVTRKKKEVSFSLDEMDSGFQNMQLHVNLSPEPSKYAPEKPPRQESPDSTKDLYDKVTTRLETLRLQQMLMGTRARQHHPAPHPDDSRSESSGETSSGDSGRGASEEEVTSASPSTDDQKVFDYIVPSSSFSTSSQSHRPSPSKADSRSVAPPPIPHRTYRPYSSFNRNQTYTGNQDYSSDYGSNYQYLNDSNKPYRHSDIIDPSALSWQHAQPRSYSTKLNSVNIQSDFSFSPSQYRLHPRDDDDCSTTTSGSYTLHSIEDLL
ncbi:protocadherin-9-like [Mya arenaria]|uniref:protocadherin-9-like n=1 Tax=Mya arenaria TaxID=6604 RepID=UPI0022E4CFEB|nr:protocadherin-9-like [Mya arenaria]XP_052795219.1 protocadherin-9-like [Mya arenaria]XP_052795220.1 protocadherin-9-like [Mya arenaria]XP_052795221.1 protocadherin-9-like [Mya arenaria]XP_052795223.1 protocadherin-9-like [Mya arenaria]